MEGKFQSLLGRLQTYALVYPNMPSEPEFQSLLGRLQTEYLGEVILPEYEVSIPPR